MLSCVMAADLMSCNKGLTDICTIDANGPFSIASTALQIAQPRITQTRTTTSTALISVLHQDITHVIALGSCT